MKTNLNPQRNAVPRKTVKKLLTSLALCGASILALQNANAQPFDPTCLSTSIDISTGLDNAGSTIPYPTGTVVNDPYWMITMMPTNTITINAPLCAKLVDATEVSSGSFGTRTVAGAAYISFAPIPTAANYGSGCGVFQTYNHSAPGGPINNADPIRFTRKFYIDGASPVSVTIDMDGYGDDIVFMAVDATPGTPIYNNGAGHANNIYYQATTSTTVTPMSATKTITLSPGMHTIDMDLYDISLIRTGLSIHGTITTNSAVLAENSCYGENNCDIAGCSDECYWTVTGNHIHNGNNKFGTLDDYGVDIITNGVDRGIFTPGGGAPGGSFFGWNTMAPTSILHVNCDGNHDDGSGMSDVRFENLEHGDGNILVIDDMGHVFRTDYRIEDIINGGGADDPRLKGANIYDLYEEEKAKVQQLESQMSQIQARLDAMENCCSGKGASTDGGSTTVNDVLYQNTPNPFGNKTNVSYYIHDMKVGAYIAVYDMKGLEMSRYDITQKGDGTVTINSDGMLSGLYTYSLVVDNRIVDTKKMVLSKED